MGTHQPLPRPYCSGSYYFPPNALDDEGDSMESLFLPLILTPNPQPSPPLPTHDHTETRAPIFTCPAPSLVVVGETGPDKETIKEDLSNSIHAPRNDKDTTMSENPSLINPSTPYPYQSLQTCCSH
ncbi:uncharacterized protein BJ212DRAFT_1484299 [Suillus subaureus]|uniref:Uncharacterized protein n=1 Tax=Suillus subaureus TaxID=48587 RepID=A0A9P7E2B7_9AGAM|nr:uncharacterized protein BJ212DRAFT_1484299 [Suillus subaureus]KAG1809593.1 hypothetical protein BJ212DRAFT_1484299 [Suillus subaureus]